jgi:hypothetical protein
MCGYLVERNTSERTFKLKDNGPHAKALPSDALGYGSYSLEAK